jgi:hypothetical protein
MEYAGFLDWLWHRGDTPFDLVDLSEAKISYPDEHGSTPPQAWPGSIALLNPETIAHNGLWDLAAPLQTTERLRYRERWGSFSWKMRRCVFSTAVNSSQCPSHFSMRC